MPSRSLRNRSPAGATYLSAERHALTQRLNELLPQPRGQRDMVAVAMRDAALAPGKRVRPLLLMLAARDLGCEAAGVLDLAAAIEMVHAASLVLDDMPCMDDAVMRRGQPATHRQFGEDVAILSAVASLSRAFGVVAVARGLTPEQRGRAVAVLSDAVGDQGLVMGQYMDLREGTAQRSAQSIATANELKTSALFKASLELAAIVASAGEDEAARLRACATELGQAFQLADDLLDISPMDSTATGKDIGQDRGKSTLVAVLGDAEARRRLSAHMARADGYLAEVGGVRSATRAFIASLMSVRPPMPEKVAA